MKGFLNWIINERVYRPFLSRYLAVFSEAVFDFIILILVYIGY